MPVMVKSLYLRPRPRRIFSRAGSRNNPPARIPGEFGIGKNKSKFHFDALVDKVTITAEGKTIAKNGKFLI